jgi:hypothetical protein
MINQVAMESELAAAQTIADFLADIVTAEMRVERTGYGHMGATLTDTVLQAGLNYRSVIPPRVMHVLTAYPEANTTSSFWQVLCDVGPSALLRWSHPEKIERLSRLIALLRTKAVETESELSGWLSLNAASAELLTVRGIGPKTVDYLKILVGIPTVAADRHVKALFRIVGLEYENYDDFRSIVCHAAHILNVQPQVLDGIIWQFFSSQSPGLKTRICSKRCLKSEA